MTRTRFVFTAATASLSIVSSLPVAAQTRDPRLTAAAIAGANTPRSTAAEARSQSRERPCAFA